MADRLKLVVQGGAMIGETREVAGTDATLGGKGSGANFEVSGVTYGVRFAEFRVDGSRWVVEEITEGKILLNGRRPRRRNVLKQGDVITVPGIRAEEPIDVEVVIERVRSGSRLPVSIKFSRVNPVYLTVGVVYLLMFVGAGMFLSARGAGGGGASRMDITDMIRADIARVDPAAGGSGVIFGAAPRSFDDLRVVLASDLPQDQKDRLTEGFVQQMQLRFAEARRAADLGLAAEARGQYRSIIALMRDGNLQTTGMALRELAAVEGR